MNTNTIYRLLKVVAVSPLELIYLQADYLVDIALSILIQSLLQSDTSNLTSTGGSSSILASLPTKIVENVAWELEDDEIF